MHLSEPPQDSHQEAAGAAPRRKLWLLGRRRNFLVDPRRQIRTILVACGALALLLSALLVSLHVSRVRSTRALVAKVPTLETTVQAENRSTLVIQVLGAVVFLATAAVVTLLETHKTSGAAFNLRRSLERIRDGRYGTRVTLRRDDNLQDVACAFNEMSIALDERLWQDVEVFEALAARAADPSAAPRLAEELSRLAAERRRLGGHPASPEPVDAADAEAPDPEPSPAVPV